MRDLNDEINRLLREKRHWENQIVALGGANYRRNVAMLDDDGKEVPGTKGYKYIGRAKELPGVKELFMSKKTEEDEDVNTDVLMSVASVSSATTPMPVGSAAVLPATGKEQRQELSSARMSISKAFPEVRGHTSYLTFAVLLPAHVHEAGSTAKTTAAAQPAASSGDAIVPPAPPAEVRRRLAAPPRTG